MNFVYNNASYNLHIITNINYDKYAPLLQTLQICNSAFVSKSYESITYDMLSEPGYVGFFCTNIYNTDVYLSLVIDLTCAQIMDKITDTSDSNGSSNMTNININNSIEIVMLCSNANNHIKGLTYFICNLFINKYVKIFKPTCEYILLFVAKKQINPHAISFYMSLGFTNLTNNGIMVYKYAQRRGGSSSKKRKCKSYRRYRHRRHTGRK